VNRPDEPTATTNPAHPNTADGPDGTPELRADWRAIFSRLSDGADLDRAHAEAAMGDILRGAAGPARIGALLLGLSVKGEAPDELVGFAAAMMEASEPLPLTRAALSTPIVDLVGTGGSAHRRRHALNVSTMASIVAAAAGATVCKHGNRKASSTSGSFDFLEALGVAIDLSPAALGQCIGELGLGFAFARTFHPAMRFAGPVRTELGVPTVFNLLGPLANPAQSRSQVIGVATPKRGQLMAEALRQRGRSRSWVVAGLDGIDELSTAGPSQVWMVHDDAIEEAVVDPSDLGLSPVDLDDLAGGSAADNVRIFEAMVAGVGGPAREVVQLNAGAGLVVAGLAGDLAEGLALAGEALDDGRVAAKLDALRVTTNRLAHAD
jgi:anthranilate phosphoribosyltransferase